MYNFTFFNLNIFLYEYPKKYIAVKLNILATSTPIKGDFNETPAKKTMAPPSTSILIKCTF